MDDVSGDDGTDLHHRNHGGTPLYVRGHLHHAAAILLAEAATLGSGSPTAIMQARFIDTVLGCAVGLAGGACLHSPAFRDRAGRALRRLVPLRLRD